MPKPATEPRRAALADQQARDRARSDLASNLFVEAGAGSGKTKVLVDRVLALVTSGEVELANVAAITFTEKAAAELRDRVTRELERYIAEHPGTIEAERCQVALDQADGAAIGTLHSFAQRVLREHAIEAGLPPRVEVLDEVSSDVAFDRRWSAFQDELFADPHMQRTLALAFAAGVQPEALRYLARVFEDNWDLVKEMALDLEAVPEPPPLQELLEALRPEVTALLAEPCSDPEDRLRQRVREVAEHWQRLESLGDEAELLGALGPDAQPRLPSFKVGNCGRRGSWGDVDAVRARLASLGEAVAQARKDVVTACARRVASAVGRFTLAAAEERRAAGQLQFHDLLVLASSLLRNPEHGPAARASLHERYQRVLLDEFQDTDPIQVDLAVLCTAAEPAAQATGRLPWWEVEVAPGRLFVVGDPKQSIYRFRRADIKTFLDAAERFGGAGGRVELTTNFRSAKPIIEWANRTFGSLVNAVPGSQPAYVPLVPARPTPGAGPAVSVLGREPHAKELTADAVRAAEAADVAAAVANMLQEGWAVDDGAGGWRPMRLGDVAVLVPARTSLPFLEDAFEEAGIAFRAEASSLAYSTRAVRDLLMVLRAVDDPTNYLYVISALRTPLLACGDDDLFRFHNERKGHWSYLADQPSTVPADDPVLQGLAYLRSLYEQRSWLAPSELLRRIAVDRRVFELALAEGRPRDVWRRLRFVIDQARAFSEATGGDLRQYLAWVGRRSAEGPRAAEVVLPEADDDAVRVMTVHAAKGLEFPVTVLSGMSTAQRAQRAPVEVAFLPNGKVGYRFSRDVVTEEYEEWKPLDDQMSFDERVRLLYVACTRARDHLVVSLHRRARAAGTERSKFTDAELLVDGMGELLDELPDATALGGQVGPAVAEPVAPPPPFDEWLRERTAAIERASQPGTVAASALSDEGSFDVEKEPGPVRQGGPGDHGGASWPEGRYGSAVGRAVHAVLQVVDLRNGEGLDAAVAAQCEAEGAPGRAEDVRGLATMALGAPIVQEAARSRYWRELYVCAPVGGRLLEGYVDLLYRAPEGLVVVDYKTAATSEPAELDRRLESYRNQGASYAALVAATTGERVERVVFLFLTPTGAVERTLPDLDEAVEHVRELVAAGGQVLQLP
ncbi:MAG: UvrD-helicase domain-containing protein [Acidimicrobiales bacterium]